MAIENIEYVKEALAGGARLWYDKTADRFSLHHPKAVKKLHISKKLNELVRPMYLEQKRKENPNNSGKDPNPKTEDRDTKILEEDARLMEFIRGATKSVSKPILATEIESAAWFHKLTHSFGALAYHLLVGRVDWTAEDVKDPEKALKKLADRLIDLLKNEEELKNVEKLRLKVEAQRMYIEMCTDLLDEATSILQNLHRKHAEYVDLTNRVMCYECKNRLASLIITNWALGGVLNEGAGGVAGRKVREGEKS